MRLEWLSDLRLRCWALLQRRRLNRDLEEEIRFHLDQRADSYRQQGLGADEAARFSRRQFGSPAAWKEVCRDMWTFRWMEVLSQDLRYAARTLRRSPGFAIVVTLTLALGIGANTAIFSVFDAVVLQPLPYPEPSQLVSVVGNVQREGGVERRGASRPDYADWRDQSRSFAGMAMYEDDPLTFYGADGPELLRGEFVAQPYFELLGVRPILGRTFRPEEDEVPQRDAVVVLSSGLWQRRFGGDPGVVGRAIRLNDRSYSVIGVLPEWFRGITDEAELWVPLHMETPAENFQARGSRGPSVVARLKPGVSMAQAQAEMNAICKRLEQAYPNTNAGRGAQLSPLDQELFGDIRGPVGVLLAAVGLVLLIACTNVANLLLVRSEARQREMAVRAALGAGRARVFGQLATESCLLAFLGAAGGLLLARWGIQALLAASPITFPSYVDPSMDLRVMLFALVLTCGVGILLGLAPAVHLRSMQLHDVFKQSSHQSSGGRQGRGFRNVLVIAEVALAMLLLVGAGLLMRSLQQVMGIRLGYDPSQLLTMRVSLPSLAPGASADSDTPTPQDTQTVGSARELLRRVADLPGVEAAALGSDVPLTSWSAILYTAEGQPSMAAQNMPRVFYHQVTPDFFRALRIPFVAGRAFTEVELQGNSNVAVVSENVVKRFWPGENPIGKRVKRGREGSDSPWLTIVGVVNEMKYRDLPENPTDDPDLFLPFSDREPTFRLLVRTSGDPSSLSGSVRSVLREAEPGIVTYETNTMGGLVARETSQRRFTSWLMGIFAGSALLLAMIGIYGVMAYTVTRRTQEIGIRMALGAARWDVLRLITGGGLGLVGCGLVVGLTAALAVTRWIEGLLYGIRPSDPLTFGAAGLVLMAVALFASLVPALRATRIAPSKALRDE
jgi:putative ABC transport system permease protein